jgi:nucleoside-diphosphate-sugar epimerase
VGATVAGKKTEFFIEGGADRAILVWRRSWAPLVAAPDVGLAVLGRLTMRIVSSEVEAGGINARDIMTKVAIIGATGPTGIHLAVELRKTAVALRTIARGTDKLERLFPGAAIEKRPADILDADATLRAIDDCDLVYDCIGLPGDQMHLHPVTARNIAGALRHTKVRCVQVSSYWAYYPQVRAEMDESHPRSGGPPWVRYRRQAEDILYEAGAAILHLPDFYGPQVHVSTLQNALNEAASGKPSTGSARRMFNANTFMSRTLCA